MKRLTERKKFESVDSDTLPSYASIYEKLQEYENLMEDKESIYVKELSKEKEIKSKKILTMKFDNNEELENFLSSYKNLTLLDKKKIDFLVIETERLEQKQYQEKIVARFISNNNAEINISALETYKKLSNKAKRIISFINTDDSDNFIKIQMNEIFNGIEVTRDLYYEVFYFVFNNGINFWRYPPEVGDIMEIGLSKNDILVLK